jgi:hypothetical protein
MQCTNWEIPYHDSFGLWQRQTNDNVTPFLFTKVDLKEGYWRMCININADDAYVIPGGKPVDPIQLVIPKALQLGWGESPPFFFLRGNGNSSRYRTGKFQQQQRHGTVCGEIIFTVFIVAPGFETKSPELGFDSGPQRH